jgi:hypothetical protein
MIENHCGPIVRRYEQWVHFPPENAVYWKPSFQGHHFPSENAVAGI